MADHVDRHDEVAVLGQLLGERAVQVLVEEQTVDEDDRSLALAVSAVGDLVALELEMLDVHR